MAGERQVLHDLCAPWLAHNRAQHHYTCGGQPFPRRSIRRAPAVWILKKDKTVGNSFARCRTQIQLKDIIYLAAFSQLQIVAHVLTVLDMTVW
jgi:hypothetical protein